jgi:hypothetical protein
VAEADVRRARFEALFPPWALAGTGLAASLALLFQPSLAARAAWCLAFVAIAGLAGKRVPIVATLLVVLGIVGANLLVPVGRVLLRVGPFRITETALLEGLQKALTFEGLVYVSKACILPALRLPGRFGGVLASAFVYYERILEFKGSVRAAKLVEDADALMLRVWEEPATRPGTEPRRVYPAKGYAILAVAALLAAASLALPALR